MNYCHKNSYQLGDEIHYRVGDSQMEGMISIRREKAGCQILSTAIAINWYRK